MKEAVGIIGAGNMCQTLVEGWLQKSLLSPEEIFVSTRTKGKLTKLQEQFHIQACQTNEELVDKAHVVILAMKPQDLEAAVEPIASSFTSDHLVVSLAAGIQLKKLKKLIPQCTHLARLMANTPARIFRGTFAYCTPAADMMVDRWMKRMFEPLGYIMRIDEGEAFEAFTVASSGGVGFILELMIYWQEWLEERGLSKEVARALTAHTFAGTAELAMQASSQDFAELQAKVTSKKGITAAGLDSMRELEVERLLRYSFEKAALRDRELARD